MTDTTQQTPTRSTAVWLKMIAGSLLGLTIFMLPFSYDGEVTIMIELLRAKASAPIEDWLPFMVVILMIFAATASTLASLSKGAGLNEYLKEIFVVPWYSILFRIAGAVLSICAYWKIGPEPIWGEYTGEIIMIYLMPTLMVIFLIATILLPFLLDFGGVEFIGYYLQPIFQKLFRLPGRASVLTATSWVGSGTNGIIAAEIDYKKGLYTGREISVLCLGFGTISIPAVFIYATSIAGLEVAHFLFFVVTLFVVGIVSTMILARIPPLSLIPDEYYNGIRAPILDEPEVEFSSRFEAAKDLAYRKAENAPGPLKMVKDGVLTTFSLYMTVFPLIVLIAILALITIEFTPAFDWLAVPLTPALTAIGLPEAQQAAPAFLIGFADLLLPYLAAEGIESQLTKFVICVTGTITVICMSETGAILLKSKIPLNFMHLLLVFLLKTIIALPIALAMGMAYGLS